MICAADIHLRRARPRSRIDDYWHAQETKVIFMLAEAVKSPPLVIAGDLFHQPHPGDFVLSWFMDLLDTFGVIPIVTPGQHDLPYHSLKNLKDSGLGVLWSAKRVHLLLDPEVPFCYGDFDFYGTPYGLEPTVTPQGRGDVVKVLLWHHMAVSDPLWPGQEADKGPVILTKYPAYDLVITGDNHQGFATHQGQRWLVNPGSMMRMTAAQVYHYPALYRWEDGKVDKLLFPIEPWEGVFDLTDLEEGKERDLRIKAFVDRLSAVWEAGFSFEQNLENALNQMGAQDDLRGVVWQCLK